MMSIYFGVTASTNRKTAPQTRGKKERQKSLLPFNGYFLNCSIAQVASAQLYWVIYSP